MTERLHFHFSLSCIGEGNGNPLQCSCLRNPRDGGAWWAAVYGVAQSRTRMKRLSSSGKGAEELPWWLSGKESAYQRRRRRRCGLNPLGRKDSLEEEMATDSSILAWRIPWTEEPGRLQSMESQTVGHDWAHTYTMHESAKSQIPLMTYNSELLITKYLCYHLRHIWGCRKYVRWCHHSP